MDPRVNQRRGHGNFLDITALIRQDFRVLRDQKVLSELPFFAQLFDALLIRDREQFART